MKTVSERVRRLLTLIPYLRSQQGVTIDQLARYMAVSPRQILRDLDCILMCGVPPYLPDDYVTYWIEDDRVYVTFADQFRAPVRLSLEEALSLKVFLKDLAPSLRAMRASHIESIETKLNRATSAAVSLNEVVEEEPDAADEIKTRGTIEKAIAEKKCLRIEYFSYARGVLSERDIAPHKFSARKGMLYLIARTCDRRRWRSFRLDRIKSAALLEETFDAGPESRQEPPEVLDVANHRGERHTVKVRFGPKVSRWIRELHPEIITERLADGAVCARFETDNPRWAALWILPYREHAEILEPEIVRREMRALLSEMMRQHA